MPWHLHSKHFKTKDVLKVAMASLEKRKGNFVVCSSTGHKAGA